MTSHADTIAAIHQANKISGGGAGFLMQLHTIQNADDILFTIGIMTSQAVAFDSSGCFLDQAGQPVNGVCLRGKIAENIYTANASINGLAALSADNRVKSLNPAFGVRPLAPQP